MTELIESDIHIMCEQCGCPIKLDRKIAFVFNNISDPPVTYHVKCTKKNIETKPYAVKVCLIEHKPERYIDLKNPEKKASNELSWKNLLVQHFGKWTCRRGVRRTHRRRRW